MKKKFKLEHKKILVSKLNQKGQAASTDALIFLGIVSVVFVLILGFSMNYGLNIMNGAKKLYMTNYHYSALKTFMNASYGRDALPLVSTGENSATEIPDSVVTMIKEDYGANTKNIPDGTNNKDKNLINPETKIAMFSTLDELFLPLPQRSYFLMISHTINNSSTYVPLIFLLRTVDEDGNKIKYICYPNEVTDVEKYLRTKSLDLIMVEGTFGLYAKLLSKEDSPKESGAIYLASWVSDYEQEGILDNLNCELFQLKSS